MPELEPEESLEEEEPPPTRPLHQSPPELLALELPLSEVLPGASAGVSGTGSGPALTVTLTRLFTLTVEPAAGFCPMMVPAGLSLYCSVVLRPPLPAANAQTATIGAAVAVCRAVQMLCGLELAIKWVNDLYYKGKKVCGILTEAGTDLESGQLEWLVVGIGLNLTATAEDFPPELTAKAGSLYPGGPAPVSRAALAGAIGRELLALCPGFACLDEYRARCFVPGHWVTVCTGSETYAAQALSIDDAGRLVVQREGGRTEALRCGEVTIRPTKTE